LAGILRHAAGKIKSMLVIRSMHPGDRVTNFGIAAPD